jgi:hypothetical protein
VTVFQLLGGVSDSDNCGDPGNPFILGTLVTPSISTHVWLPRRDGAAVAEREGVAPNENE